MDTDSALKPTPKFSLPDGHTEFQFKEAVREVIRACGGNRKAAQGIAIDLVREETEQRS